MSGHHEGGSHFPGIIQGAIATAVGGACLPAVTICWKYYPGGDPPEWVRGSIPSAVGAILVFGLWQGVRLLTRGRRAPEEAKGDWIAIYVVVAILFGLGIWASMPWTAKRIGDLITSNRNPSSRGTPFYTAPDYMSAFFPGSSQLNRSHAASLPTGSNKVSGEESFKVKREEGLDWSWPAIGSIIARRLGPGIGIDALPNSPIRAMATGTVYEIGTDLENYGIYIKIRHSGHISSDYLIQNGIIHVLEGQKVERGGLLANCNNITFPFAVFFQILRDGELVDASAFLPPLSLPPLQANPPEP